MAEQASMQVPTDDAAPASQTTANQAAPPALPFAPTFGWPNVLCPEDRGLAIEDVWPSLYIGHEGAREAARKVQTLDWAKATLQRWRAEAELVLQEEPSYVIGADAGSAGRCRMIVSDQGPHLDVAARRLLKGARCRMIVSDQGPHLLFQAEDPQRLYNPATGAWIVMDERMHGGWGVLQHERVRRLMSSLALLHHLTGDERYSRWVWRGLRHTAMTLYDPATLPPRDNPFGVVYGGLYEAQAMLQLVQAFELVENAPGRDEAIRQAMIDHVFLPVGEALSAWMDKMLVHNMSCWSMAALALLGRLLARRDWVDKALHSERCGLRLLLTIGLPRDDAGRLDGLWQETSTFYNFYALLPLIPLYRVGEAEGAIDDDLRERFAAAFAAPLHLCDERLRMLTVGDRMAMGGLTLPMMRHAYEYAAGQVDAERYGPILAMLYEACGAPRAGLAAMGWGLDQLPQPAVPPRQSVSLPAARMATFRGEMTRGLTPVPVTCWFLGGGDTHPGQGHHHHDKLALSLHADGRIVTSDLGLPAYNDNDWSTFLEGSFSHNTLLIDEADQGPMEPLAFDADVRAAVPWAYAKVRGDRTDAYRANLWNVMLKRGDEVRQGVYDGVELSRRVWFDLPYIVLDNRFEAVDARRFGLVFHAHGSMVVQTTPAAEPASLDLPDLPDTGAWSLFVNRTVAEPIDQIVVDWRITGDLWLRLAATADAPFEATWGRTSANPRSDTRGTMLLRVPGRSRRVALALELHRGTPTLRDARYDPSGAVRVDLFEGTPRRYAAEAVAPRTT